MELMLALPVQQVNTRLEVPEQLLVLVLRVESGQLYVTLLLLVPIQLRDVLLLIVWMERELQLLVMMQLIVPLPVLKQEQKPV